MHHIYVNGVLVFYGQKVWHKNMETWACLSVVNKSWFGKCFLVGLLKFNFPITAIVLFCVIVLITWIFEIIVEMEKLTPCCKIVSKISKVDKIEFTVKIFLYVNIDFTLANQKRHVISYLLIIIAVVCLCRLLLENGRSWNSADLMGGCLLVPTGASSNF